MYYKDRVILLKGNPSNWYEQAIFIVKDDKNDDEPRDLVAEAEKIANGFSDYPTQMVTIKTTKPDKISTPKAKSKPKNPAGVESILHAFMIVGCVVAAGVFFWYFIQ